MTTSDHTDRPAIDLAFLTKQTNGDNVLAIDVLRLFIAQASGLASRLATGPADDATLAADLHRLKGAARAVGAGRLGADIEICEAALGRRPAGELLPHAQLSTAINAACSHAAALLNCLQATVSPN